MLHIVRFALNMDTDVTYSQVCTKHGQGCYIYTVRCALKMDRDVTYTQVCIKNG